MIKIFIVDDEAPARARLRVLLEEISAALPNEIVGEAENGRAALEKLIDTPADVILLDIRMPVMDGIVLARHLSRFDSRRDFRDGL